MSPSHNILLEKTLRYIVLTGVFLLSFVVLVVTKSLFFPFISGKNFTFRIIVEVIFGAWIALMFMNAAYRPRVSAMLVAFGAFVAAIALSDALGEYPFKSFWSNYERMEGWITLAHLFGYFVVVTSVMTESLWRRLFQVSLGVSAFVSLYGLLQLVGFAALGWGGGGGLGARLDATLGNPTYLAAYMLFHIFIAALVWGQSWMEVNRGRVVLSLMYGSVIALDTIVLLFTGTRGSILGLLGGVFLVALLLVLLARNSKNAWRAAAGSVATILILAGLFYMVRDASWVRSVGFLDRLATISVSDNTVKARFMNWGMAWKGAQERPLLGWGQENYALVFDKYYNAGMYAQEQWFDRVHNTVLDWLIAGGFFGLALYLLLFGVALAALWRGRSSTGGLTFSIIERCILTGLLAGYFFHNLFVFDNITSYILFVSVLAYIAGRNAGAANTRKLFGDREVRMPTSFIVAVLVAILVWGVAWGVNAHGLAQNRALLQALGQQKDLNTNIEYFKKAAAYGSYGTQEVREQVLQVAARLTSLSQVPSEFKNQVFAEAAREMELQIEETPGSARFPLFLGILYDTYGKGEEARVYLERARDISPTKQAILLQLGLNAFSRGDASSAIAILKETYELAPEFKDARILYAVAAIRTRQDALAEELIAPLIESGDATDVRIISAYVERKRYDKAAALWEKIIEKHTENASTFFALSASHYANGNVSRALEVLEEVKRLHPDSSVH